MRQCKRGSTVTPSERQDNGSRGNNVGQSRSASHHVNVNTGEQQNRTTFSSTNANKNNVGTQVVGIGNANVAWHNG